MKGKINTILVGAGSPSEDDVKKMFGWSAHKFGQVSNLPEGHLYKEEAPKFDLGEGDPHWDNVVTLLHFDEDFQDEIDGITWSNLGNNTQTGLDKINPIVGSGSLFVNSGTVGGISRTPVFTAANDDFTIEVLVEFTSLLSGSPSSYPRQVIWDFSDSRAAYDYNLAKGDDGSLIFDLRGCKISSADDPYLSGSYIPSSPIEVGKKYHIAHTYTGNRHRFFLNGELILSLEYPRGMPLLPKGNSIGARTHNNSTFRWASKAKYDEFRITKGVARYTENFTPPTEPFPNF